MNKVSAIITTHNRLEYLKKAIESVKKQTYDNLEIIVVDDASNDGTENYCINDKSIKYIRISKEESKGGNYARNIGIDNSNGEYIAFLDDDDEWYPEKITKQVDFLNQNADYGVVYCNRLFSINNGIYEYEDIINKSNCGDCSSKIFYNIIGTTSMLLFRREILLKCRFDEKTKFWQEYDLMIRVCQITKIGYIDEPLILYRQNFLDKNRLTNKVDSWFENVKYINEKYSKYLEKLSLEEIKLRKIMIYYDAVTRYSIVGDKKKKREYLKKIFLLTHKLKDFIKYILNIDTITVLKKKAHIK